MTTDPAPDPTRSGGSGGNDDVLIIAIACGVVGIGILVGIIIAIIIVWKKKCNSGSTTICAKKKKNQGNQISTQPH